MNLILWHGYLLSGTGSNIYTQHVARRLGAARPRRARALPGAAPGAVLARARACASSAPRQGRCCRRSCSTATRASRRAWSAIFSAAELERYLDLNASALAAELEREPADLVMANHAIMGGPVAQRGCAASATPYAVKLHGSELEYAIRGSRRLADLARGPLDSAHAVSPARSTSWM